MAQKPLQLVNGITTQVEASITSVGAADSGKVVALDASGKIDSTMMPTGVAADVKSIIASEAIGAYKYVNIYNNAGVANIRLADNSNNRPAHGYVKAAVAASASGVVFFESANDGLSALTPGSRYYLATVGGVTLTPPTFAGGAQILQFLGIAISATEINTDIEEPITLA